YEEELVGAGENCIINFPNPFNEVSFIRNNKSIYIDEPHSLEKLLFWWWRMECWIHERHTLYFLITNRNLDP
ncbi:MAG: hypothetical protein KJ050_16645, partial [Candidatus Omnitrophica bacterium]|nr:hypothetical protein [Candidatus Omnitrophota bacterium]